MVIVFRKKTITTEIGQILITAVGALIAVYHVYRWEFNSDVKEVLNFLQEKLTFPFHPDSNPQHSTIICSEPSVAARASSSNVRE